MLVLADGPLDNTVLELLGGRVDLLDWPGPAPAPRAPAPRDPAPRLDEVQGVYTYGHPPLDRSLLDRLPRLRVISNYGVGVDHIDLAAAAARGVPVGNTPNVLDGATADMGMALLLAAARRLAEGDRYARGPEFTHYDPGRMLGREVHGARLGILGMGRIGRQVARRARGFEMTVSYHNRRRDEQAEQELGVTYMPKQQLLSESDFVMVCVPLTPETHGLIGREELRRMPSTSILVNIARGPVVDTAALTEALRERLIYAAGLDVTDPEPLPRDHELLTLDNVVIAPHLGSATEQTRRKMAELSVENLFRGLDGRPLLHEVRPPA